MMTIRSLIGIHNGLAKRYLPLRCSKKRTAAMPSPIIRLRKLGARLNLDPYVLAVAGAAAFAAIMPVSGSAAEGAGYVTGAAIALLFFLHGARLAPAAAF